MGFLTKKNSWIWYCKFHAEYIYSVTDLCSTISFHSSLTSNITHEDDRLNELLKSIIIENKQLFFFSIIIDNEQWFFSGRFFSDNHHIAISKIFWRRIKFYFLRYSLSLLSHSILFRIFQLTLAISHQILQHDDTTKEEQIVASSSLPSLLFNF